MLPTAQSSVYFVYGEGFRNKITEPLTDVLVTGMIGLLKCSENLRKSLWSAAVFGRTTSLRPLAPYLDAYLKHIEQEAFLPSSAPMQMYAIARFSKWLRDRQFDLHQVDEAAVNRFLKRDPGVVHSGESATLRRLLAMLRQIGVTVAKASESGTCHQRFIVDYRRYLLQERASRKPHWCTLSDLLSSFCPPASAMET